MALVFIYENTYQQYYSEFVASRIQNNSPSIIFVGYGINKSFFLKSSNKHKFIYIKKNRFSFFQIIIECKSILILKKLFNKLHVTDVFLYKDHNCNCFEVDCLLFKHRPDGLNVC